MQLYSRNRRLTHSLFQNPTAEFRGAPFWSWNGRLDTSKLLRQIDVNKRMGFGGAHIHSRTGLAIEYLGPEFMRHVKACVAHAKKIGLLTWLYDEDRWPSGFAGGLLTRENPQFAERFLLLTPRPYGTGATGGFRDSMGGAGRFETGKLLWRYAIQLNADGTLKHYRLLKDREKAPAHSKIWYAYIEPTSPSSWFNHHAPGDVLSPRAMQKFVEITYDAYKNAVGSEFGKSIPAIFTDEPHHTPKTPFKNALDDNDLFWPFTDDLPDTYFKAYGTRIEDNLPEIFWELPDHQPSLARYRFHDHLAERFAHAFADTLGNWCKSNGILLTGHLVAEPILQSQTASTGDIMRPLRAFDIPGIDMLCDWREYTTAKQSQSVARQFGRPGVMSELYGVTGWHFDFVGHKGQGDWQAALGVTLRVPHLQWVSMAGESKRDYPAAIGHQSPWHHRYPVVEDHFARLNTVLTRGNPVVRVAVLHPIESFWLAYGPLAQTRALRAQREEQFRNITEWLLFANLDFDYIAESLLPQQSSIQKGKPFAVGEMNYDAVLVPALQTIRSTTLDRLEAFADAGGRVLFVGQIPALVDAVPSNRPARLAAKSQEIPFERVAILDALQPHREISITPGRLDIPGGEAPADPFLYQLREDNGKRYLFICNTDRDRARLATTVSINGTWKLTLLDTLTGSQSPLAAIYANQQTHLTWDAPAHGHILLELTPGKRTAGQPATLGTWTELARLDTPNRITLSEPNCLLLDLAEWRILPPNKKAAAWQPLQELLKIDDAARDLLQIPRRQGQMAQPWADTRPDDLRGTLELRFAITSDIPVAKPQLALEDAADIEIFLDNKRLPSKITGHYVDEAIPTVNLPPISKGDHQLLLRIPMKRTRNVEWAYLLGDFGVHHAGHTSRLIAAPRTLNWGDWTRQGLPFYGGNVTYHCTLDTRSLPPGDLLLEARDFANPLLDLSINNAPPHPLAFAPFRAPLPEKRANLKLDLTAYGNRANSFGMLHFTNRFNIWFGPRAYRSTGDEFALEHQLRLTGILTAPILKLRKD